jgi:hypothetical protein
MKAVLLGRLFLTGTSMLFHVTWLTVEDQCIPLFVPAAMGQPWKKSQKK